MRARHVDSLQGWLEYERLRYLCHECGEYYYPLDQELALSQGSRMSEQKERQLALLSVRLPYEEAKLVYEELTGVKVGRMTAHRSVQRLGGAIAQAEASGKAESKLEGEAKRHASADGVMIHIREEGWKETKVGSVYEVDEERKARGMVYTATLEDREVFGQKLYRLAGEPEASQTQGMAFISDAAKWLTDMQELLFPLAIRIVDFWHVTEYLWDVANTFYQEGTAKGKQWAEEKVEQLREGKAKQILEESLSKMKPKTAQQRAVLEATVTYFQNHSHEMNYPLYEQMGYHIGSGVVESACKYIIQSRFKRSGMRWSRPGAENLLRLRLAYLNKQWDELLETARN